MMIYRSSSYCAEFMHKTLNLRLDKTNGITYDKRVTTINIWVKASGEIALAAPKGLSAITLRQKNRCWTTL